MKITTNILERGRSSHGAWSKAQLECLGVGWPPLEGWRKTVLEVEHKAEDINKFLSLKDAHLSITRPQIIEKVQTYFLNNGVPPTAEFRAECPFDLPPDSYYSQTVSDIDGAISVVLQGADCSHLFADLISEPEPALFAL